MDHKLIPPEGLPKDIRWQIGKTVASIRFVGKAEELIASNIESVAIMILQNTVDKIKSGELILTEWITPQEYLDTLD